MIEIKPKIFITGPPRSGKSTLIVKIIEYLKKDFKVYGFITPEITENNKRKGFNIVDLYTKKRFPLASVGNYNTNFKVGKYSVFVEDFEVYIKNLLENMEEISNSLFCIDEIGKMELYSNIFQEFLKKLFKTSNIIIATIGEKLKHPIKEYIITQPNVVLFHLNTHNRDEIFTEIVSLLK